MENKTENPQAFPVPNDAENNGRLGMFLRDYFAAKTISLFPLSESDVADLQNGLAPNHKLVAKFCYDFADAMLAERSK